MDTYFYLYLPGIVLILIVKNFVIDGKNHFLEFWFWSIQKSCFVVNPGTVI